MALTKTQVSELYVAIFNRASEGAGNSWWQDESATKSAADIATEMLDSDDAKEYFGESLDTDLEFIKHIYLNTLGKTYAEDQAGIDWWVTQLAGNTRGEIVVALIEAIQDEQYKGTDAQQQFLNRVEVSDYSADNLEENPENYKQTLGFNGDLNVTSNPGTISPAKKVVQELAVEQGEGGEGGEGQPSKGQTFFLTEGRDKLEGTDGADTFYGFVGQNQNGTLANELATGDIIDGGAGRDKIVASLQADLNADSGYVASVNPRTTNVEEVHIEALDTTDAAGAGTVVLDAGRMDSVEEFWSDNSSTDFEIRDVRLGSKLDITKDITFGLRETDYDTDFTARFDSQSLTAASSKNVNSALSIRVADVSALDTDKPLANVKMDLSFKLGSETVNLTDIVADGGTYLGLVTAIRAALKDAGLESLDVAVGAQYNSVTFAGNTVNLPFTASELLIVDPNGESFTDINFTQSSIQSVPGGFLVAGNADNAPPSVTSNKIETNLILDNAGRGSTAGDVNIAGMSNSNKGVQVFNVTVDRNSKIDVLKSQDPAGGQHIEEVVITSKGANGNLVIQDIEGTDADGKYFESVNANGFKGESLQLGAGGKTIDNLDYLDAGSTTANVTFNATYNGGNGVGDINGRPSDKQEFKIQTGSGNDKITASVNGTSTSGSTKTSLQIDAGNGNNTVEVDSSVFTGPRDVNVKTGSGADVIHGNGTNLTASTGAGNDVIYAENTGNGAYARLDKGSVFNVTTLNSVSNINAVELLHGRTVQVTVEMPKGVVGANAFVNGLEVSATVLASKGYLTTERDLYEAAAKAINDDPVVNKLVEAKVDSNGHLIVEYIVDGVTVLGEQLVELQVLGEWKDVNANHNNILNELKAKYQDSKIDLAGLENQYNLQVQGAKDYAEQVAAGANNTATDATVGVAEQLATYSLTLAADIVLDATDTISIDINGSTAVLYAATANGEDTTNVIAGLPGTIAIDGITYDVDSTGADNVTLTQQSPVAANYAGGPATISAQDLSGTGNATIGTTAPSQPAVQDGVEPVAAVLDFDLTGWDLSEVTFTIDGVTSPTYDLSGGVPANIDIGGVLYTILDVGGTYQLTQPVGFEGPVTSGVAYEGAAQLLGTDSWTAGVNVVNGGLGDDVIVLSSNAATTDTIKIDAGGFGNDTIVHFTAGAGAGHDQLDFTQWLDGKTSTSGSVESQRVITTTSNNNKVFEANEVEVINFNDLLGTSAFDNTVTFATVTNADVLKALNTGATFTTGAATADLVGDVRKAILMVEDEGNPTAGVQNNEGMYKVYEVTFENDAGNDKFTAATLVGSLDFGESQAFTVDNFA